jgi:hypothetical protein
MSQTSAQKVSSIRYGSGVMRINGVNVGLINKAKLEAKYTMIEIKASNGRLPPKKKIESAIFTAELVEVDLTTINSIDTYGVLTTVSGASTPVTAEVVRASGSWGTNELIFLANGDGDKTVVSSIVVKNGATTLTVGTDYAIVVENGKTGIVRVGTALTLSGIGLNVGYTYTPNASKKLTYSDVIKLVQYCDFSFINTDENGKEFRVIIPKGYSAADITMEFPDDDATDTTLVTPIEVRAFPDSGNVMLRIEDEQSVA